MGQCTYEVHAEQWNGIIKACLQRPTGQSVKTWMNEKGICEQNYCH